MGSQLSSYDFGPAGMDSYVFLWDEYADWYIEISKRRITGAKTKEELAAAFAARRTLVYVLDSCLRLLHPFMPYVTEEIWQRLPHEGPSLMVAPWPQRDETELPVDKEAIEQFDSFQSVVKSIRNARAEYRVEPGKKIAATILANGELGEQLKEEADALAFLARLDFASLHFAPWSSAAADAADDSAVRLVLGEELEARLPLADMVDTEKERKRLGKQKKDLEASIEKLTARLSSPGFASKAPPALVDKAKADVAEQTEKLNAVTAALDELPA